jgi:hypothetical protein
MTYQPLRQRSPPRQADATVISLSRKANIWGQQTGPLLVWAYWNDPDAEPDEVEIAWYVGKAALRRLEQLHAYNNGPTNDRPLGLWWEYDEADHRSWLTDIP